MIRLLCVCCILVSFWRGVEASLAEEMAEATQLCCNQGTAYARNYTSKDCTSSVPPDVPSALGSLCIFAMDQCCKEYYQKKEDCDGGIQVATNRKSCSNVKDSEKQASSQKASGNRRPFHGNPKPVTLARSHESEVASVCEEYAPNELCAHYCIPIPGSYKCECKPGFMLMPDRRNCKEVSKNRCKPRNPCHHKCIDNGVEIKCTCRRGYKLMSDGKTCQDIDECVLDPPVCLPNTQCFNVQGSYKCIPLKKTSHEEKGQCPAGFARNIKNNACDDINECLLPHPPCPSYLCENTIGGYKCGGVSGDPINLANIPRPNVEDRCPPGFKTGYNEECEDVDECAIHKDDCNSLSQFCINTRGSFYCQDMVSKHCPPGFKIDPTTNKCEDINECEDGEDICRPDQICVNVPGQYDCRPKVDKSRFPSHCPEGMRMSPSSNTCEDIDECVEGTHLCDQYQTCLNTNGSHECRCKPGFDHDPLTGACVDINECATDLNDCIPESQRCDNTVGSYLCIRFTSCGTGYILHHSSGKCEDIDECALGIHNCARAGPEFHCINIAGSFRCIRDKPSTTSTTPAPEYEYEYYDSEEEVNTTNTKPDTEIQPKEPEPVPNPEQISTTTTTLRPELQPSESPQTTPTTTPKPQPSPEPEIPKPDDDRTNDIIPDQTYYEPKPEPKQTEPPKQFETTYTEPKEPEERQRPPTYDEPITPEEKPVQPEPSFPKEPESNYNPEITTPKIVYVNVQKETATVKAEKTPDGSVFLDTQNVPKNEWTRINEKPTDCQQGFEPDGYGACFDIDECATNRHSCSGLTEVCRNTMGGYRCECAPGFRRDFATEVCALVTSSSSTTTSTTTLPPPPPTTKRSLFWGYPDYRPQTTRPFRPRNLCDVGFHMNSQTGKCEDINECTNGQANCAAVEICVNTEGGYRCECPPNWKLDKIRHKCVPFRSTGLFPPGYGNEPAYLPDGGEVIISHGTKGTKYVEPEFTSLGEGSTVMKCPWGYKLGDDNTCEDINECATGEAKCGSLQICTNLPGGYSCSCPPGHKMVGDHECEDVDECNLKGSMAACGQNSECVNTIGSYQCKCHDGFRPAPANDKVCVDVDECVESRSGSLCQQRCNNVWGGYRCSCHRGYRLNADNSTCSDVDECTESSSKKILCVGRCLNEPGSYRCSCPPGYRLSEDKRSCIDIDECETGEAPCSKGGTYGGASDVCLNTRGGYRCHRITCPTGYRIENKHRCTKVEQVCPPADWNCAHQPSTYSYNFITFVSKLYIPDSKVDLFTMRGPAWPYATMRFELRLIDVNAPPTVKDRADIGAFLLTQTNHQAVLSLMRSLEGPQSIELELSMELFNRGQFGGIAVAKLYIYVSEYEF